MFQPDAFLTDGLAVFAQSWASDFRAYWNLDGTSPPDSCDPEEWQAARTLDVLAQAVAASAQTLDRTEGDWGRVIEGLRTSVDLDLRENQLFTQCLEVHLVRELEDELDRMRRRALTLTQFLVSAPHERTRAFLARVGACYVRGLDTEAVVMCGAVLDAALQERFDDDTIRESDIRCGKFVSLGNRIEYAAKTDVFDAATEDRAFSIAHERNKAIHTVPQIFPKPEDVMCDLRHGLRGFPHSGSSRSSLELGWL